MDEKEWAVVGQFNEGGKEVPKVHGKDQWTVWDPKKRAQVGSMSTFVAND